MEQTLQPIGIIHSCFKEKFGIPRQSGLIYDAPATLELLPPFNQVAAVKGLESFSHIWVIFSGHGIQNQEWKATVRPPRLGGNQRLGVFATRSLFRPSRLGLSVVKLERIDHTDGKLHLIVNGGDFLDQTPVLDIKPYLPYTDCLENASGGYAAQPPSGDMDVIFDPKAQQACLCSAEIDASRLKQVIEKVLKSDPRPAYYAQKPRKADFGMRIFDVNVRWRVEGNTILVTDIESVG